MATTAGLPPSASPSGLGVKPDSLPPLVTNVTPRRTKSHRPTSYASKRLSSYSSASRVSNNVDSRPGSHVFPIFHSSLPYTLVRDFAYTLNHPLHYGPPPTSSTLSTPISENRRLSDPAVSSWEDPRSNWSAGPPWMEDGSSNNQREQLPAMSFSDGGPPYSEDDDLHSPIVTTAKNKKFKSKGTFDRGRSPGTRGQSSVASSRNDPDLNGPGEAVSNDNSSQGQSQRPTHHRDSNFAKPIRRSSNESSSTGTGLASDGEPSTDINRDSDDPTRFSKDYSFTIASPDEEMHGKAVALFDFESEHHNELALREGQIVLVSYRQAQGWLVAQDPRTGESGLVPEEFVRLVKDIEGGLNGLSIEDNERQHQQRGEEEEESEDNDEDEDETDDQTPLQSATEPTSDATPTAKSYEFPRQIPPDPATGGGGPGASSSMTTTPATANTTAAATSTPTTEQQRHPPVQSTFSTSSKDLEPYPIPEEVKVREREQSQNRLAAS